VVKINQSFNTSGISANNFGISSNNDSSTDNTTSDSLDLDMDATGASLMQQINCGSDIDDDDDEDDSADAKVDDLTYTTTSDISSAAGMSFVSNSSSTSMHPRDRDRTYSGTDNAFGAHVFRSDVGHFNSNSMHAITASVSAGNARSQAKENQAKIQKPTHTPPPSRIHGSPRSNKIGAITGVVAGVNRFGSAPAFAKDMRQTVTSSSTNLISNIGQSADVSVDTSVESINPRAPAPERRELTVNSIRDKLRTLKRK
jgi:hypothetical protein